jgi:hypothetical protein
MVLAGETSVGWQERTLDSSRCRQPGASANVPRVRSTTRPAGRLLGPLGTIGGPHVSRGSARRQRCRTSCTVHDVHDVHKRLTLLLGVKGSRVQIPPSQPRSEG